MQIVPRDQTLPVKRSMIPWAANTTNAAALRSLLLHSFSPDTTMYVQEAHNCGCSTACGQCSSSSYAVVLIAQQKRYMIIGNLQSTPDYAQACQSILDYLVTAQSQQNCGYNAQGVDCQHHHHQHATQHEQQESHPQQQIVRLRAVPTAAIEQVRAAFEKNGYLEKYAGMGLQYIVAGGSMQQLLLQANYQQQLVQRLDPEQYELSTLELEDAHYVNDCWIYRAPGSLAVIQEVMASGSHTSCVRKLPDRTPVAWALEMEPGYVGVLHTVEQHRRKGLARVVLLSLLSKLLKQHVEMDMKVQQCLGGQQNSSGGCRGYGSCSSSTGASGSSNGATAISSGSGSTAELNGGMKEAYMASRSATCCCSNQRELGSEDQQDSSSSITWPGGAVYCYVMEGNAPSVALLESVGLTRAQECWWMGFERM